MPWLLVDLLLGGLALLALVAVGVALYRHVKALIRAAGQAGKRIGEATAALDAVPGKPGTRTNTARGDRVQQAKSRSRA